MSEKVYRHTAEMGEISGFGGGYEKCCQDMLEAGVKWLEADESRKRDLVRVTTVYNDPYNSKIVGELKKVILSVDSAPMASVFMCYTVMTRLVYIAANGWDKYVEHLIAHRVFMCNTVMSRLYYMVANGWDKYVEECTAAKAKKETSND